MSTYVTTLTDNEGYVHRVTMPWVNAAHVQPVVVTAACGIAPDTTIPARQARLTSLPEFRGRSVTCPGCLLAPNS
jgi:hypothetical protein